MILDELSKGLREHDIIEKLQIPHMSYYRYKRALSKQIAYLKTKLSEQDVALAEQILENRLTRDRVNAA
jgi:AmiR/NasT family two-component response regulator